MSQIVFKEPDVPVKKGKRKKVKVLDEDTYLDKMGRIIERDFFPDLKKLVAQNDYLEAVEKNDTTKLREIYAKYSVGGRPSTDQYNSPATFETPSDLRHSRDLTEEHASSSYRANKQDDTESVSSDAESKGMSLNKYLANYTSEDNRSFEDVMDETEARRKQKQPWLYKDEKSNAEALGIGGLEVPAIELQLSAEIKRPLQVDTWGYKNRNFIMYVPDGENSKEASKGEILHSNTRFNCCPFDETQSKERIQGLAQQQVKVLDGKIGVDGKEVVGGTPQIGGYTFVRTPSPAPGVSESPLMTWGEIEGTPFRLDHTPGPSFRIPEPPRRERLAHALADKHASDRKKRTGTPAMTPKQGVDRLQSMSPAARRLANTQLRKAFGTKDKALIASYSPRISPRTPHTPNLRRTPSTPTSSDKPTEITVTTDNLLNINLPRRPKASDFFA